jgi:5-formyltetrahydrofolate cyclo-ligase
MEPPLAQRPNGPLFPLEAVPPLASRGIGSICSWDYMLNISEKKSQIRELFIQKRKAFGETACRRNSRKIEKQVLASSEFALANVIHIYLSDRFEVKTDSLIEESLRLGKRIVVPVLSEKEPTLSEIFDLHSAHFQSSILQVREPHPQFVKRVLPEEVELWIIPAVAYDTMGHRLGRGGGYYDRLLEVCSKKIICLAFEFQCAESFPFEKTDRNVDMIITENRTIIVGEKQNAAD